MNKILKDWLTILVSTILGALASLAIVSFSIKHEDQKDLKKEIDSKAPYEYVDKQDYLLRKEIESNASQHALILQMIKESRDENLSNFQEIRKQLYRK